MAMTFNQSILVATIGPVLTVLLAAIIGQRISAWWSEKQKRRELELTLASGFYSSYGEFFAIWKQWNWVKRAASDPGFHEVQTALYDRACTAEGAIEAVLLKLAAERRLSPEETDKLGVLRQAYQMLRECIWDAKRIPYSSANDPQYLEFKRLSIFLGNLLATKSGTVPSLSQASKSFAEITDNKHELRWDDLAPEGRR
jgi:hypothetical protein